MMEKVCFMMTMMFRFRCKFLLSSGKLKCDGKSKEVKEVE